MKIIIIALTALIISICVALGVYLWYQPMGGVRTNSRSTSLQIRPTSSTSSIKIVATPLPTPIPSPTPSPAVTLISDATSTLATPVKIATYDGKQYFIFGQPAGQNSKTVKKIIFSLPGHGTTAESDYAAWKGQITDHDYALASLNWWDGKGEAPINYYSPQEVVNVIKNFLSTYGYKSADFVVLEGFSRGSANTYPVKAFDISTNTNVIDAVISASGKYQSDFAMTKEQLSNTTLFKGVLWILACGEKDPNPTRDGCSGMEETKTFLSGEQATVLAILKDPNGGHGAFHQSPLKLVDQALSLLDNWLQSH